MISLRLLLFFRTVTAGSVARKSMGWLAVAPQPQECPTGHRYLRSPLSSKSYLGGPLSLCNWSESCTVNCLAHINCNKSGKYNFHCNSLPPLTPLEWNYGIMYQRGAKKFPTMFEKDIWHLVSEPQSLIALKVKQ